jgi:hypothetical protein
LINDLEEGFRVFCGDHRLEEFPFTMPTSKIAMPPSYADGCKSIFLRRERTMLIGNNARDGEGKLISEVGLPNLEGLCLELLQRSLH